MTEAEIIRQCGFNYETKSYIWMGSIFEAPAHPLKEEDRRIVENSRFLHFREAVINNRVHEVVEIVEEPLKAYLSTLEVQEGLFFAGRFFRDFYKATH